MKIRKILMTISSLSQRTLEIIRETSLYSSSYDIYHLAFPEHHRSKLITFDKGFKKLHTISKTEIIIH